MDEASILSACELLAERLGVGPIKPEIVGRFSNTVVALDPLPIVARVATGTALLRDTIEFARQEVALAGFLANAGAPVVGPAESKLAGPHVIDGLTISLWRRIEILPGYADGAESGRRLRDCHAALKGYPEKYAEQVPYWGVFDELVRLLDSRRVRQNSAVVDRDVVAYQALECRQALQKFSGQAQVLHGDAHQKNVFNTSGGPLWADWEDTIRGPVEWDLACMVTNARVTGENREWAEAAISSYGEHNA